MRLATRQSTCRMHSPSYSGNVPAAKNAGLVVENICVASPAIAITL